MCCVEVSIPDTGYPIENFIIFRSPGAFGEDANPSKLDNIPMLRHIAEPGDAGGLVGGVGAQSIYHENRSLSNS